MGQLPTVPSFGLLSYLLVLVQVWGGNAGGLLLAVMAVAARGLGHISLVPPDWLKLWLEWDIPKPYGPSPGI